MDKPLVEREEDKTTSKRNRVAKSARGATKYAKRSGKPKEEDSQVPGLRFVGLGFSSQVWELV